jgi:hypothetical protein
MESFHDAMIEYRNQLARGYIQEAYQGLMAFFRDLRSHFINKHPEYSVSKNIYYGYMDMTYFSLMPSSFKRCQLKVPIVFIHSAFRFEIWLSGSNRDVQEEYWKLIQERNWNRYHLVSNPRSADYVIDHVLVDNPDFRDLSTLKEEIERGALSFISDVEGLLSEL